MWCDVRWNLKSLSNGKGNKRFTSLIKTSRSGVAVDRVRIERAIASGDRSSSSASFFKKIRNASRPAASGGGGGNGGRGRRDGGGQGRNLEGAVVGATAEPIGSENVGHQLMLRMGFFSPLSFLMVLD